MSSVIQEIENWVESEVKTIRTSKIATMMTNSVEAALQEFESLGITDLENITETAGVAMLTASAESGGNLATGLAAGVVAAEAAFKADEKVITQATLGTFVTSVNSQLQAQAAASTPTVADTSASANAATTGN